MEPTMTQQTLKYMYTCMNTGVHVETMLIEMSTNTDIVHEITNSYSQQAQMFIHHSGFSWYTLNIAWNITQALLAHTHSVSNSRLVHIRYL